MRLSAVVLLCVFGFAVSGCAIKPILTEGETAQIVDVSVTTNEELYATDNILEDVRVKTQDAAYRFSETGREKALEIDILHVHVSSPGAALFIGGHSTIGAKVKMIDKASGVADQEFDAGGIIQRLGGIIGAIAAAGIDEIEEERELARLLAENIMLRIYGEEVAAEAAHRKPSQQAIATYPISYDDARRKNKCKAIERANRDAEEESARNGEGPAILEDMPEDCVALLVAN